MKFPFPKFTNPFLLVSRVIVPGQSCLIFTIVLNFWNGTFKRNLWNVSSPTILVWPLEYSTEVLYWVRQYGFTFLSDPLNIDFDYFFINDR